jgi:hypothetical protein
MVPSEFLLQARLQAIVHSGLSCDYGCLAILRKHCKGSGKDLVRIDDSAYSSSRVSNFTC